MGHKKLQIRCQRKTNNGYVCGKRLFDVHFEGKGTIEIVCPRCKQLNSFQLLDCHSEQQKQTPKSDV